MLPRIRKIRLKNWKSYAACEASLGPLTILVGPNGAGKSNFVDALRFVRDALDNTLEWALRHQRGGVQKVRRISRGHPNDFAIALDLEFAGDISACYEFAVGPREPGGFIVKREHCRVTTGSALQRETASFEVENGILKSSSIPIQSVLAPDRLSLVTISAHPVFRPVFDHLCNMSFYDLNPRLMRDLQDPDPGLSLKSDGSNAASVIRELEHRGAQGPLGLINDHLKAVFPDLVEVIHTAIGPKETLKFRQRVQGGKDAWTFDALNMSDGTIRALGVLVALFPPSSNGSKKTTLVAVEEPETAIHPGAVRVLGEAFLVASSRVQVVLTTHSPDLLDHEAFGESMLRAVRMEQGRSFLGPIDEASRSLLQDRLYTAGELLRKDQMQPEVSACDVDPEQLRLFSDS